MNDSPDKQNRNMNNIFKEYLTRSLDSLEFRQDSKKTTIRLKSTMSIAKCDLSFPRVQGPKFIAKFIQNSSDVLRESSYFE